MVEPSTKGLPARQRHHYLGAIFSASEFTEPAQQYAYAQDVYLVPLAGSTFMGPVIRAIGSVQAEELAHQFTISAIGRYLRRRLLGLEFEAGEMVVPLADIRGMNQVIAACNALRYGAIAMFGGRFPAFLVAAPEIDVAGLGN